MNDLGWTPVLSDNGQIYCSPRCGGKCRKSQHDEVKKHAEQIAERMGQGWEVIVWENLGWHSKVTKGCTTIHINFDRSGNNNPTYYSAWIEPGVIGSSSVQIIEYADTPEDALGIAVQKAHNVIIRMKEVLAVLNDTVEYNENKACT